MADLKIVKTVKDEPTIRQIFSDAQIIKKHAANKKWSQVFDTPAKRIERLIIAGHFADEVANGDREIADRIFVRSVSQFTNDPNQVMRLWQLSVLWRGATPEMLRKEKEPEPVKTTGPPLIDGKPNPFLEDAPPPKVEAMPPEDYFAKILYEEFAAAHGGDERIDTTEKADIHWFWEGYIPLGKLVVYDGDPGVAKSMTSLALAVSHMYGKPFLDGTKPLAHGSVILLSAEDDLKDTIIPRLVAAGAPNNEKVPMVHVPVTKPDGSLFSLADSNDRLKLEMMIERMGVKLIIIDPLNAYLGDKVDSNNDQKIRQVLGPLSEIANRTGAVIIALRHLTKAGGSKAMYRGLGSIGYTAAARVNFFVAEHPEEKDTWVLSVSKISVAAKPRSIKYQIELVDVEGVKKKVPRVKGAGFCDLNANELSEANEGGDASKLEAAMNFLRETLKSGAVPKADIEQMADDGGISEHTLRRAKDKLGVHAFQDKKRWHWGLAQKGELDF